MAATSAALAYPARVGVAPRRSMLWFGINYAPEPTGCGLMTAWQTRALAERGWEVSVVTGVPHYPWWRRRDAPRHEHVGAVRVSRRRHYVPRRQSAFKRGLYEATWVLSALPDALTRRRVDAVVGVVPSLGGAALAATAAAQRGVPFALVFQDLMGPAAELGGVPGGGRVAAPVRSVELALARRAAGVAVVSSAFRDYLVQGGVDASRIHEIRNPAHLVSAQEPRADVRARLGWGEEVVALYSGSLGHKQALGTVLDAAELARDAGVRFVLQGDGNQRDELEVQARARGLANVTFAPLAPYKELPSILAAADVLLLTQRASVVNLALPSKLATYFSAGVPVVAAVDGADSAAHEVHRAGAGVVVPPEDPQRLLEAVLALRADRSRATSLGAAGRRYAAAELSHEAAVSTIERFFAESFALTVWNAA